MKKFKSFLTALGVSLFLVGTGLVYGVNASGTSGGTDVGLITTGFATPPSLTDLLSFFVKFFFVVAGLIALLYLLLGAFAWITSGGEKEAVKKAQDKIQAAVIGLVLIVGVLAIVATLERYVFSGKLCLGITCTIKIPSLVN